MLIIIYNVKIHVTYLAFISLIFLNKEQYKMYETVNIGSTNWKAATNIVAWRGMAQAPMHVLALSSLMPTPIFFRRITNHIFLKVKTRDIMFV